METSVRKVSIPAAIAAAFWAIAFSLALTPGSAWGYTPVLSDNWENVPVSTINLYDSDLGYPDLVVYYPDENGYCDFGWAEDYSTSYPGELYVSRDSVTSRVGGTYGTSYTDSDGASHIYGDEDDDGLIEFAGTATVTWYAVGEDSYGDQIDVTITVSNVEAKDSNTTGWAPAVIIDSSDTVWTGGGGAQKGGQFTYCYADYDVTFTKTTDTSGKKESNDDLPTFVTETSPYTEDTDAETAVGSTLFYASDLDIWNSSASEGVVLLDGFEDTVYLGYDSSSTSWKKKQSGLEVNTTNVENDTYWCYTSTNNPDNNRSEYSSGWASNSDPEIGSCLCVLSNEGSYSCRYITSGASAMILFDSFPYTLSADVGEGGSLTFTKSNEDNNVEVTSESEEDSITVWWKNDQSATIEADAGYYIKSIAVDDETVYEVSGEASTESSDDFSLSLSNSSSSVVDGSSTTVYKDATLAFLSIAASHSISVEFDLLTGDITLEKMAASSSYGFGEDIVWTVTVSNASENEGTATNVIVSDDLPSGLVLSAEPSYVVSGVEDGEEIAVTKSSGGEEGAAPSNTRSTPCPTARA